jgi:hypothetical protein
MWTLTFILTGGVGMKSSGVSLLFLLFFSAGTLFSQNLLQNGDFESWTGGLPDYWMIDDSITVIQESGNVHEGSYSAKVNLLTQTQSLADLAYDTIPISPSQMYLLTAWFYDNDPAGRGRLVLRWYDSGGNYISSNYGSEYTSDQSSWQQLSLEALSPANASFCVAGIRFYDDSASWDGDAVFYVDNVSLTASATGPETLMIHEIQGEAESSPYVGQVVVTTGVVTGVMVNTGAKGFFIEEKPEGPWKGIFVYTGQDPTVTRGDSIVITAEVDEYYDLTELKNIADLVIVSQTSLPDPILVRTGDAPSEQYEGVLLVVDSAVCTNPDLGYGEWEIDDGSGPLRVDDLGISYTPTQGHPYKITGPLYYSYGDYKIEPRDTNDIIDLLGVAERNSIEEESVRLFGKRLIFNLKKSTWIELNIYDSSGRLAQRVYSGYLNSGGHVIELGPPLEKLREGVYFLLLRGEWSKGWKLLNVK